MNNPVELFKQERKKRIASFAENTALKNAAKEFNVASNSAQYSYNFSWLGRPIIQYPQDIIAMQEIIWEVKPDLIIEIGIAHGGSLICYASILQLIGHGQIVGIDIDIRKHNKKEIEDHFIFSQNRIKMIEGSSLSGDVLQQVKELAKGNEKIIVSLDSNHTHEHVLQELRLYAPFVSKGSYIVVFDTIVEDLPEGYFSEVRPWGIGNNPKTAVKDFLEENDQFVIDHEIDNKLMISVAPEGYLKRIW